MEEKSTAPAIERMLRIIELLSHDNVGYSYNEIARMLNIPLNSVYRICVELEKKQYLVKESEKLFIGPSFYMVGRAAEERMDLVHIAHPFMRQLYDFSGETVHLDIRGDDHDMILLHQIETKHNIKMSVSTGTRAYLHASGFGKCLLAFSDYRTYPEEKLVALTANTFSDRESLYRECEKIRECGYAIDNEEYVEGVYCVGAPIFDPSGDCVAALGIMYLKYRYNAEKEQAAIAHVTQAASRITEMLCAGRHPI